MKLLPIFFFLPLLYSFKFSPMSQSLELKDNKRSAQFTVENESAENMAIELTVKERKMKIDGKEDLPDTNELSVFPPQIIIPPKEKRTVRVMYNGPANLPVEKAYRVIAEQLPLDVNKKKKGSGIQMLMKYMSAFYVTPEDAEAKLSVQFVESAADSFTIKVTNSGNKHEIITKPILTFKKGSEKKTITSKDLEGFAGENVLAKTERVFVIKSKQKIPAASEVTLKLEE